MDFHHPFYEFEYNSFVYCYEKAQVFPKVLKIFVVKFCKQWAQVYQQEVDVNVKVYYVCGLKKSMQIF